MKAKKFLLVPSVDNPYDIRMLRSLGEELKGFGHECIVARSSEHAYVPLIDEAKIDVVLAVNKSRPKDYKTRHHARYVSWYQDVFLDTSGEVNLHDDDILYTLGTPKQLGLRLETKKYMTKPFYTGVNDTNRASKSSEVCDFSLCAGLPLDLPSQPSRFGQSRISHSVLFVLFQKLMLAAKKRNFFGLNYNQEIIKRMKALTEQVYRPLEGSLDIYEIEKALRAEIVPFFDNARIADDILWFMIRLVPKRCLKAVVGEESLEKLYGYGSGSPNNFDAYFLGLLNWMSQTYPRIYERRLLIEAVAKVSDNIHIYGNCMDRHDFSSRYYKGTLHSEESLANVYANSRVNLGNNTHGLGLHSRNLAVMAAGGFLLHHRSREKVPGSLESAFEEGVHYIGYNGLDNLKDVAKTYLDDSKRRHQIGTEAQKYVFQKHSWKHRASELLGDLCLN
ncbi:MAG: glycosyltransferase family 1 protein [Nitrospira sp.]|nr:glycosyltransferase family 1 protein [Nitrospira sp.]MBX3347933.1 glycosyltransferase family 1 protein [Nitrospira sp.]